MSIELRSGGIGGGGGGGGFGGGSGAGAGAGGIEPVVERIIYKSP